MNHRSFAGPWGASYLLDLSEQCGGLVDCVFIERDASLDFSSCGMSHPCTFGGAAPVNYALIQQTHRSGARLMGVDLEYEEVARRRDAYMKAPDPLTRDRAYEERILDRNRFMAERMIEAECDHGILLVGASHVWDWNGHDRRTIPALLAEAGIASMVFEPRCVRAPPGGFPDGRTDFPAVRITAPDEDSFGDLVIEAGCIWE